MKNTARISTVLVVGALLVAGCARENVPGHSPSASPQAGEDKPMTNLKNEQVASIDTIDVVSDRQVRIHFTSGDPDCYGSRAAVKETDSQVLVGAITGLKPGAPEVCKQIGRQSALLVTLDKPIGNREVKKWDEPELHK